MIPVDPPIVESWELPEGEFPDVIEIDGKTFHRAIRQQGYDGVICQYREMVPRQSAHLFVMNNGTWQINHIDEYNPDMGYPVRHFIVDHPAGKGVLVAGAGLLGIGGATLVGAQKKRQTEP